MNPSNKTKKTGFGLIMAVYLAGIFMGAIDTGIVTPARTLIQTTLGVDAQLGIWMITIYTLAYAASIPIMGKIADKHGRKKIYLLSILLFGLGSLLSGLSQYAGSFGMLLIARAIQAIGGGGIVPVATAEFGTTFPKEKRGVALGLVGGVYGIANIFGASAGSLLLDLFGATHWSVIFFINLPITLFILIAGIKTLPDTKSEEVKKIDIFGITALTLMILSLLYGLKSIDFLDFFGSFSDWHVWAFLLLAVLIFPLFLYFEKKAEDPVINLSYFKNRQIVVTLVLSFLSGVILMGTIFVPQFAENAVKIPTGSGGYFVIVLGLFAGIGAPTSGRLIDKFGVKPVLGFGFAITILAALFVIFVAIPSPSVFAVIVALVLMGLGMGFSLGTPLNYMMLENTKKAESNSALATLSLIRSIGTTIAPSIMVAFIASAGMLMQTNVAEVLPANMTVPGIAHADEVTAAFAALKDNPLLPAEYADYQFPDYSQPREFPMTMQTTATSGTLDPSVVALIQSSDVTTIAANTHTFYASIFDLFIPQVVNLVTNGVQNGVDGMNSAIMGLNGAIAGMNADLTVLAEIRTELAALNSSAFDGTEVLSLASASYVNQLSSETFTYFSQVTTLDGFDTVVTNIESTKDAMASTVIDMQTLITALVGFQEDLPVEFGIGVSNYLEDIDARSVAIEGAFQDTLNQGFHNIYLTTMAAGIFGFLLLQLYQSPEKRKSIKKDTSEV